MSKQNEKYKFSIVVPCYNEEKNIPILVERFKNFIENENNTTIFEIAGASERVNRFIKEINEITKVEIVRSGPVAISTNQKNEED